MLNDNDLKLLELVIQRPYSVNELSRLIGITPTNISTRLPKLEQLKLIHVDKGGKGKKTYIDFYNYKSLKDYILILCNKLKQCEKIVNNYQN